jgi:hypothetical protein
MVSLIYLILKKRGDQYAKLEQNIFLTQTMKYLN